ncbi:MAG: L,D-transpeptidase [Defluviimonas sp.]|nr:L,D-transpeptidase [Paracoccaceae bacterium]MCC0062606.1 L,D-transpeptidase [Defluviimonas sp.]
MKRRNVLLCGAALMAAGLPACAAAALAENDIALPPAPLPGVSIAPELYPTIVRVKADFVPGSIHVLSSQHFLYYIARKGLAIRYGVAVGKAELVFRGEAVVGRKVEWPSWKPTPEMIERNPRAYRKFADGMPGGPTNPLGARAIYLFQNGRDTAIRIHGTTDPNSIGKSVSNGCLRMVNEHVIDLYGRVALGAPVTVY